MIIGSVGSHPSHVAALQSSRPEAAERGPDNDHDADDKAVTAARSSHRSHHPHGGLVDIHA